MGKYCVGIDLGGTFIKFGVLDEDSRPSEPLELPTPTDGPERVAEQMASGARRLIDRLGLSDSDVIGVGIGSPGPLSLSEGLIIASPNLPGVDHFPIRDRVAEALGLPAVLENDANAAALGEFLCGAGRNVRNMVMLTLGTGVGSGVIIDGVLLHGAHEIGAELGHIIVDPGGRKCGCGQHGCLEQYASATYIAQYAARRMEAEGIDTKLAEVANREKLTTRHIVEAVEAGDSFAGEVWDEAMRHLAVACVSIARIFDPEEIVLAGGMAKAGDALMRPVSRHFRALHWDLTDVLTHLELARLGNDAGFIGAAGVAWRQFGDI